MKILELMPERYDEGIAKYSGTDFNSIRNEMLRFVSDGDRVLDIGCGPGTFAIVCAKKGASVEGVDINPGMLYTAEHNAEKEGVADRANFSMVNAAELDFPEESFDVVTAPSS